MRKKNTEVAGSYELLIMTLSPSLLLTTHLQQTATLTVSLAAILLTNTLLLDYSTRLPEFST